jgi:GNAT superfamily N-acetyltransferase
MRFTRRCLQRRPAMEFEFRRVERTLWRQFAPHHYMSAELPSSARCFALTYEGQAVAFAGVMTRPYTKSLPLYGISRVVVMPDWQGLGLGMVIMEKVGALLRALRLRMNIYPAHPSFIQSCVRSPTWRMLKKGTVGRTTGTAKGRFAGTPGATFQYAGPAMEAGEARKLAGDFAGEKTRMGLEARRLLGRMAS